MTLQGEGGRGIARVSPNIKWGGGGWQKSHMTICITISLVKGNKGSSHITQDGRGRRNDQFKTESEFIIGATNDRGNDIF